MPSAGKMREKTISGGSLTTPKLKPESTMTLSRTLVNRPKKPFQSPGTHGFTRPIDGTTAVSTEAEMSSVSIMTRTPSDGHLFASVLQRPDDVGTIADPAENAALRGDHPQTHLVKLRKIRTRAVAQHQTLEAAIVGFAHRRVDANFGRHAADEQLRDAAVLEHRVEIGRVERALAGLVDDGLAGDRCEIGDDVVTGFAANEDPAHRPAVADADGETPARGFRRRQIREIGTMAFTRVHNKESG